MRGKQGSDGCNVELMSHRCTLMINVNALCPSGHRCGGGVALYMMYAMDTSWTVCSCALSVVSITRTSFFKMFVKNYPNTMLYLCLNIKKGKRKTWFQNFKMYPPDANFNPMSSLISFLTQRRGMIPSFCAQQTNSKAVLASQRQVDDFPSRGSDLCND